MDFWHPNMAFLWDSPMALKWQGPGGAVSLLHLAGALADGMLPALDRAMFLKPWPQVVMVWWLVTDSYGRFFRHFVGIDVY